MSKTEVDAMYSPLEQVAEALAHRQRLRERVENWWQEMGWGIPPILHQATSPLAFLCRNVATARYEDIAFTLLAQQAGLSPTWFEYHRDRFVDHSPYKYSLIRMYRCEGRGRKGGALLSKLVLASPIESRGKTLCDIEITQSGTTQPLVDYHHHLHDTLLGPTSKYEASAWLATMAERPPNQLLYQLPADIRARHPAICYYPAMLSLAIAHGAIFEDYHGGESGNRLDSFTSKICLPALRWVTSIFQAQPLIVRMPWHEGFQWYPGKTDWKSHSIIPNAYLSQCC